MYCTKRKKLIKKRMLCLLFLPLNTLATSVVNLDDLKNQTHPIFTSSPNDRDQQFEKSNLYDFKENHSFDAKWITAPDTSVPVFGTMNSINIMDAVQQAVLTHPDIQQQIANFAAQNENIAVARSGYFPQFSGGINTGDMTTGERGRQLISFSATQMLYDFGKVKSSVDIQTARSWGAESQLLITVEDLSQQVASTIVNIKRLQEMVRIAEQQIIGIQHIVEITQLRARAGLSSQADPVQAQSYLESAQANLIAQNSLLIQYQLQLQNLIGFDIRQKNWVIPDSFVAHSDLYVDPEMNHIPKMLQAHAEILAAQAQKFQAKLSRYPTLNVKGSMSQAVNGRNPNNNEDNGFYSSIMLEANSNFFQGGAIAAQTRSASYAEQAARAKLNSVHLDILDQIRISREQIAHKQEQMKVLLARQRTTIKTKELYQEQYKLGTRSALDLLNAEQSIHMATSDIENARYDIYSSLVQYIAATGRGREVYGLEQKNYLGNEIKP